VSQKKDIKIIVFKGDEKIQLFTYTNEYRNLMELLSDKLYLENFGECKGMGRCCTCLIKINSKSPKVNYFEGNE
jgi:2Fe-2S ferredoxin